MGWQPRAPWLTLVVLLWLVTQGTLAVAGAQGSRPVVDDPETEMWGLVRDSLHPADVAAFLGAAYFRAVGGDTRQYGLSARALAVDTAYPRPEEFPRFTDFWFERPAKGSGTLILYALLFLTPYMASNHTMDWARQRDREWLNERFSQTDG